LVDLRIDREKIDAEFKLIVEDLTEKEKALLSRQAASTAHLLKAPDRIEKVVADIADHFLTKVAPNGLKAQLVVYDKEACVLYKKALEKVLPPEFSAIDMSMDARDPQEWRDNYKLDSDSEEKLLERYRDPADQLQILIVTAKLLTGFDAPILQTQYLDKPLRDHTLLQAICRTNRPFSQKTHENEPLARSARSPDNRLTPNHAYWLRPTLRARRVVQAPARPQSASPANSSPGVSRRATPSSSALNQHGSPVSRRLSLATA
jgi:hypothetical protein